MFTVGSVQILLFHIKRMARMIPHMQLPPHYALAALSYLVPWGLSSQLDSYVVMRLCREGSPFVDGSL